MQCSAMLVKNGGAHYFARIQLLVICATSKIPYKTTATSRGSTIGS
jgi:hypothetical protein